MDLTNTLSFPFLSRRMLAFEHATTFGLQIVSQANQSDFITIRGYTQEGLFTLKHAVLNDGSLQTENFRLPDFPIAIGVFDDLGLFQQGDLYVSLSLTLNGDVINELCSGLVYQQKSISYPASNSTDRRPGGGNIRSALGANPDAGSEFTITVPNGHQWKVMGIKATLITDATAANRRVHFVYAPVDGSALHVYNEIDHVASTTRNYHGLQMGAMPDSADNTEILIPLPQNFILDEGSSITSVTTNLQATDNWGAPVFTVEEFYRPT